MKSAIAIILAITLPAMTFAVMFGVAIPTQATGAKFISHNALRTVIMKVLK